MRSSWLTGALLGACLALLVPAAAGAVAPPPTVRSFDDLALETDIADVYRDQGIAFSQTNSEPCPSAVESFGDFAPSPPHVLGFICGATLRIDFAGPQAYVAMRVFLTEGSGRLAPRVAVPLTLDAFDAGDQRVASTTISAETEEFRPISVLTSDEVASIAYVVIASPTWQMDIDDVAYSDAAQPDTEITSGPASTTSDPDATFEFVASVTGATFECDLDGTVSPCGSPTTVEGLGEGPHAYTVTAIDGYGGRDPSPPRYGWTVDRTPPDTQIDPPLPPPLSSSDSATISFSSPSADVGSFECALDDAGFTGCSSPQTFDGLAEGAHRVRVRALDGALNRDPTPAEVTWTVDLTTPDTQIDSGPPPFTRSTSATIGFSSQSADVGSFECALDDAGFTGCSSPQTFDGLAEGAHRVRVRALDGALNRDPTPAEVTWTVDLTPPDTRIDPPLPPPLSSSGSATISFSSPAADVGSFVCALDDEAFGPCSSPLTVDGLAEGAHRLRVRALDRALNRDPTSALATWTVDLTAPATRIDSGPPALTPDTAANFTFSSPAADVAAFECALDGTGFSGCASPRRFEGLAVGAHRLQVRAVDAAGNRDPAPPAYDWQVSSPPIPTPQPPRPPDRDADGVPDTTDICPDDADAGQGDRDADGIGDACETFAQGDVPAVAGVNSLVRALAGDVYVKLPGAALRAADPREAGLAQSGIEKGFQPLKGVASVPVGSVVDTRKGRASISSAADFRKATDPRHRAQSARLAAGIFRIKQARSRRPKAPKRPFTELVLASASGAQAVCATKSRTSPVKGIVRQLAATTKGRFRTVGGASTTTVSKGATFVTTDRCTGTLTEVGRGRARVLDRRLRRTVTVRAGRAYLAKARLFAAKKGRGG